MVGPWGPPDPLVNYILLSSLCCLHMSCVGGQEPEAEGGCKSPPENELQISRDRSFGICCNHLLSGVVNSHTIRAILLSTSQKYLTAEENIFHSVVQLRTFLVEMSQTPVHICFEMSF